MKTEPPEPVLRRSVQPQRFGILAVGILVIGVYAWSANPGLVEILGGNAARSYYNLLVQGFRHGHLCLDLQVPTDLTQIADPSDPNRPYLSAGRPFEDLSYYKGKLYLYFGVTPAVLLFWPYEALTGRYLLHKNAAVILFSAGFLINLGLLWALWRRYFVRVGSAVMIAAALALGLSNFAPAILQRADFYEVAIGCGYTLTSAALACAWLALHRPLHSGRWLAAASLAYGLALGSRPSLLPGAVVVLVPLAVAWRRATHPPALSPATRRLALALAAAAPMTLICLALLLYNYLRFDNPLEFGQRYQLPPVEHHQFSLGYLWFNLRVCFLQPPRWGAQFPFVSDIVSPPQPPGYFAVESHAFGLLPAVPLILASLAAPLAWRGRPPEERSRLRCFSLAAVLMLLGIILPLLLHDSMALRYELEFAGVLVLLAVLGLLGIERAIAGWLRWRGIARYGWSLLVAYSVAINLLVDLRCHDQIHYSLGIVHLETGRLNEAIADFQEALKLNPDNALAGNNLGSAYQLQGQLPAAVQQYSEAARLEPNNIEIRNNLGVALAAEGRMDEAIGQFLAAAQSKPGDARSYNNLGNAFSAKGASDKALDFYRRALEVNPNYPEAHNNLANALYGQGNPSDAIAHYRRAIQLKPDYARAYCNLSLALAKTGRRVEAAAQLKEALRLNPDYAEAKQLLSELEKNPQ